ncbi:helix-turn-helix transcriptional regulator [Bacillus massiliigorillae]|uniref:helix-turn-helix transcriptional regulator n=1 Tax=Bacillus massiliigorillae TaxID=1243664 RepID=UPI0003A08672|nr:metalloregulator ArsR/SmtB family transcription factor [Bacillus massiliigorillae]
MQTSKQSTKEKILEYIKKEGLLTVNDLTKRLAITDMAVRKHLNILEKDHLIQATEMKQPMGRPLQIFSLTEKGERLFPKNYENISVEFLHDIQEIHGKESVSLLFSKREQRLTQEYSNRLALKPTTNKIEELVKIQNEKGYMADSTQIDHNTYELIEYNCPIMAVANDFKIACSCETEMLKNVLETQEIKRTCCRTDGDLHCKFLITFPDISTNATKRS